MLDISHDETSDDESKHQNNTNYVKNRVSLLLGNTGQPESKCVPKPLLQIFLILLITSFTHTVIVVFNFPISRVVLDQLFLGMEFTEQFIAVEFVSHICLISWGFLVTNVTASLLAVCY